LTLLILFQNVLDELNLLEDLIVDSPDTLAAPDEVGVVLDLIHRVDRPLFLKSLLSNFGVAPSERAASILLLLEESFFDLLLDELLPDFTEGNL